MARTGRKRGGGRSARIAARKSSVSEVVAFIDRSIPYFNVLNEEAIELIEHNSETVLQEIGIEFRDFEPALRMLKDAGAEVDGERVRFPRGLCRQLLANAPAEYIQHARNPDTGQVGAISTQRRPRPIETVPFAMRMSVRIGFPVDRIAPKCVWINQNCHYS